MPSTELIIPYARAEGATGLDNLPTAVTMITVAAASTGGFYTIPFAVPRDLDRSRPAFIDVTLIKASGLAPITAQDVVILTVVNIIAPSFALQTLTHTTVQTIPASWQNNSWVTITPGSPAATIPAATILDQAVLGVRVRRDGPNPLDTYSIGLGLFPAVRLRYNRLCHFCTTC